jgi:Fe-S-cluster-containing dehydrogenase component/DMSO reductase anchor subunit
MLEDYLKGQQSLTAVEEFSLRHDFQSFDQSQERYARLIPKHSPGPGEQYAFEVNLDQCTGCKACVTACHNENGLEEDETWRSVGVIHGGTSAKPAIQHVTGACHHCLEPACLSGCPVNAYEKDPATGVVKHLDDQCIGCQYCILKCPYDVPKYNKKKGIVRKCDMCISRLKADEAPACARACPNEAIRITLVDTAGVRKDPGQYVDIPDAPNPSYTLPTTRYKTEKRLPWNMVSSDYYSIKPEPSHLPLVVMLVLTQLSVGGFWAELIIKHSIAEGLSALLTPLYLMVALGVGMLALGASVFHLGRPLYAFRAVLGIKTSWLSREILAFGLFSFLAMVCAVCSWDNPVGRVLYGGVERVLPFGRAGDILDFSVLGSGLFGIFCSAMVYRDTKRPFWDNHGTTLKFFLTMGILGFAVVLFTSVMFLLGQTQVTLPDIMRAFGGRVCLVITFMTALKLFVEMFIFFHLNNPDLTVFKKTAVLMSRELKMVTVWRFIGGFIGGIILPLILFFLDEGHSVGLVAGLSFFILAFSLAGEFLERLLFFKAVVPLQILGGK